MSEVNLWRVNLATQKIDMGPWGFDSVAAAKADHRHIHSSPTFAYIVAPGHWDRATTQRRSAIFIKKTATFRGVKSKKNPSKSDRKLLTDAGAYRGAKGFQPHHRSDVLAARVKLLQKAKGTPRYASLVKSFRRADR